MKKYIKNIFLCTFLIFIIVSCLLKIQIFNTNNNTEVVKEEVIPIEEKIGQLLIVGYTNKESYNLVLEDIKNNMVSGVVLYKQNLKNIEKTKEKIKKITNNSKSLKPFIIIDQEGGLVSRISSKNGFKDYYSAKNVTLKLTNEEDAYNHFYEMAKDLKSIGINYNFAPCVDFSQNKNSSINKTFRSYGDNQEIVTKYASLFIKAHKDNGIYTTLKHFPGQGSAIADSHKELPDITRTWKEEELLPFKNLIKEYPYVSVMVGHLLNKNIDKEQISSLSKKTINILEKEYNHKGLVVIDGIEMSALDKYTTKEIITMGINAGVNLFLFPNHNFQHENTKKYMTGQEFQNIVLELINEGKITEEQIDNSYKKIRYIKENEILVNKEAKSHF